MKKSLIFAALALVSLAMVAGCASAPAAADKPAAASDAPAAQADNGAAPAADAAAAPAASGKKKIVNNDFKGKGLHAFNFSRGWSYHKGEPGKYNDDDNYSGTEGASFELKFMGTKVTLFGKLASHHGSGKVFLDGTEVATFSLRADNTVIQSAYYESPDLPMGEHTVKVVAVGDGVITIDKADIMQ